MNLFLSLNIQADIYSFGIICQEIMYRKGTFFRGPDDTTNAEDTVRKIIKNNQKPFLSDIDNLRISIEDNDDLIIPPNIRALGTKPKIQKIQNN